MRTAQGRSDGAHLHRQPEDTSSNRMTLRNRGEPAGLAKVAAPAMAAAMRRANEKDLARLKRILSHSRPNAANNAGRKQ
jgi:hypothetical protein